MRGDPERGAAFLYTGARRDAQTWARTFGTPAWELFPGRHLGLELYSQRFSTGARWAPNDHRFLIKWENSLEYAKRPVIDEIVLFRAEFDGPQRFFRFGNQRFPVGTHAILWRLQGGAVTGEAFPMGRAIRDIWATEPFQARIGFGVTVHNALGTPKIPRQLNTFDFWATVREFNAHPFIVQPTTYPGPRRFPN